MALKDILISYSNGSTSDTVLQFGAALAKQTDASISAVHVTPPILEESQIAAWMPEAMMAKMRQVTAEAPERSRQKLEETTARLGITTPIEWLALSGDVSDCLATSTRTHDLLVIGKYDDTTEETGAHIRSEQIVTRSGRPLVVVPRDWEGSSIQKVVIAWDGGATVARALFDVVQLLPNIALLQIVCVANANERQTQLQDIEKYVAAHGIRVSSDILPPKGKTSRQILSYCENLQADMLVMGSRGSTRLRNGVVSGGTGRTLLNQAKIPIFVSQ